MNVTTVWKGKRAFTSEGPLATPLAWMPLLLMVVTARELPRWNCYWRVSVAVWESILR